MRFSKIAMNSKRVLIEYRGEGTNPKDSIATTHTSIQKPKAEFTDALSAFKTFVQRLTGTTAKWMEDVTVTAVHLSEQRGGRRGLMISASRPVADTNAPFAFTTPIMTEVGDDDESSGTLGWPRGLDEAVTKLQAAASHYIAGDREQGDLFTGPVATAEDDEELDSDDEDDTEFDEEHEDEEEHAGARG
jgi:hypothetical protein